ncbi:hypothetical protein HDU77_006870 [Chytriomyces hyalinus]|nr:hypothetical protein HDU77_006870 [Chytriomyces hyalinus]
MAAGITIGMSSNLGWLLWTALQYTRRRYAYKIVAFVVLISCAMALEVLDFPPILWVLDAHALWHAATVPLVFLLYSFFLDDLKFEESGGALLGKDSSE